MRFLIRQKYFSIRDGFYITDEAGRNAYFVQGKIFTLGKQLTMYDLSGREILFIKQRIFRILPTFDVYQNNEVVAKIKRILPLIFVKRYKVKSSLFGDLKIKGNVFAWNFAIVDAQGKARPNICSTRFTVSSIWVPMMMAKIGMIKKKV